ncbi:MAG: excinuclease ABC subunit UvrA, partial [Chloroflexi bacterium]|nr:excinuclease ABC subunit UvrA [Chloroflexota bacterium]
TVLVVEHDEETIRSADWVIDFGPGAGEHGGEVVADGPVERIERSEQSLTGAYLAGRESIPVPRGRRSGNGQTIHVEGAGANNLKDLTVGIPLGAFVCVTGVSGSGKSTLITDVLYRALAQRIWGSRDLPGPHRRIRNAEALDKVIEIDQSPIGRTPRSNPATYTAAFTPIRELFAAVPEARARGYKPGRFSFNVKGGRCEACQGQGLNKIEMQFLPDVYVTCEVCHGARYNREALEIHYKGKNIAEVLDMTVQDAHAFFANIPAIERKLGTLVDVGLGYIRLGQPATTLSGGEAQRVKLSSELAKRATGRTLYILDEPTTGLHFADTRRLIAVLQRLVDAGNTIIVIEHNLDVVKSADWIIDLGPEGGDGGGELVVAGTPEEVAADPDSYTGIFLARVLGIASDDAQSNGADRARPKQPAAVG